MRVTQQRRCDSAWRGALCGPGSCRPTPLGSRIATHGAATARTHARQRPERSPRSGPRTRTVALSLRLAERLRPRWSRGEWRTRIEDGPGVRALVTERGAGHLHPTPTRITAPFTLPPNRSRSPSRPRQLKKPCDQPSSWGGLPE